MEYCLSQLSALLVFEIVGDADANTSLRVLMAGEHLLLLERLPLRLNRLRTWPNLLGVILPQRVSLSPIANIFIICSLLLLIIIY